MRGAKQKEMFEIEISDLRRREILHLNSVCPCVPQGFFFFFFFGGGGGGVGHHKIGLYLEAISMHFRVFSKYLFGCLKFLIFFWGER